MKIGELIKILEKYPKDDEIQVTWDSCLWEFEEINIYRPVRDGLVLIDADDNTFKDYHQGKEE